MTVPFDPGADFADVVDNLVTVQYQPRTSARGGFGTTSYSVTAHKSQINKSLLSLPRGGEAPDDDCVWNLQASDMGTQEARMHDRIVETLTGGTLVHWIITKVDIQTWQTRYRCVCTREKAGQGQPVV